jgi:2',3'-cyclic-nucleotide 2'-phosphodiesterase (5'-nucleotidase family)
MSSFLAVRGKVRKTTIGVAGSFLFLLISVALAGPPADQAAPVTLHIISTADFHGALEPRLVEGVAVGGIDVIASYFEILRKVYVDGVVLLDAGDVYQGSLISAASEGQAAIDFYNDVGYDAMVVGNHDFDFGPVGPNSTPVNPDDDPLGALKARIHQAHFPVLGANIIERQTGKPPPWENLKPYTIIKRKGIAIAVIGLTSETTALITNPVNVRALDFAPLEETLRRLLPEVRSQGARVVIVLIHEGLFEKPGSSELSGPVAELARRLRPGEIDLIVSGHSHKALSGTINGIPVMQSAPYGVGFAEASLVIDSLSGTVHSEQTQLMSYCPFIRKSRSGAYPIFLGSEVRPDRRLAKKLQALRASVAKQEHVYLGRAADRIEHRSRLDSPVGRLVTDAMRAYTGDIDVALYNGGGLRAPIPKGTIDAGKLYEVLPFDNTLVTLTLTGSQVRKILEHGLSNVYGIMELSGVHVRFDPSMPPGERVVGVSFDDGKEMERNRSYLVATNDFVVAGGDGYLNPPVETQVHNTHVLIRDIVARYIKAEKIIVPIIEERYVPTKAASAQE